MLPMGSSLQWERLSVWTQRSDQLQIFLPAGRPLEPASGMPGSDERTPTSDLVPKRGRRVPCASCPSGSEAIYFC